VSVSFTTHALCSLVLTICDEVEGDQPQPHDRWYQRGGMANLGKILNPKVGSYGIARCIMYPCLFETISH